MKREAIVAKYTKCSEAEVKEVNVEAASLARGLELDDRIECFSNAESFITIKDHKESFQKGKIDVRLINPAKSQLGKITKQKLQTINATIRQATGLNQWRKTKDTLKWFSCIPD